jgi:UDP-glucose:(heptosyl)LPS alpha-1,3-glucosyltransferase
MKKIALAIENFSPLAGGAETYAVSLAHMLAENGWEVHIFSQRWDGIPEKALFHRIDIPRYLPRPLKLILFALKHRKEVRREPFDVVLGFGVTLSMTVYQSHGGVHWLSTERMLHACRNPAIRALKRAWQKISLKHWTRHWIESAPFRQHPRPKIIAISRMIRDDMASTFHVSEKEMEIVFNGVDVDQLNEVCRGGIRGPLRRQFHIPDHHVVFLFVSYQLRKKGIEPLIEAAGILKKSGKENFSVIAVGGLPYHSLTKKIGRLGLQDRIFFPGPTRNVNEYYANADVFVLPTYYDACSLVLLEAMASGLPAITTEYNGAAGVITEGENGYIVSHPPQPEELAEKMASLLSPERRGKMALSASSSMEAYSITRNHQTLLRIFEESLTARGKSMKPDAIWPDTP